MIQLIITKSNAFSADKIPAGISRIAVRGFLASKCRSRYLLNAMAALLAVIIQIITKINFFPISILHNECIDPLLTGMAIKKPIIANGIAKIVCENLIRLK